MVERERVKWERPWGSRAAFLDAIKNKPLDTPLCSNCGKPGAISDCLEKKWCKRPACRQALSEALDKYDKDKVAREVSEDAKRAQDKARRIADLDYITKKCFHWRDGWFFNRQPDGSVRIMHRETTASEWLREDITIDALSWASIVCSVSSDGETSDRWNAAQDFHGRAALADTKGEAE